MVLDEGYLNPKYTFNLEKAIEITEKIMPYSTLETPEENFYAFMHALEYSDAEKANLLVLSTILTPMTSATALYRQFDDILPHPDLLNSSANYKKLVEPIVGVLPRQKERYNDLVDIIFDKENGLNGDIRNIFDVKRNDNVHALMELPGIRMKLASLMVQNIFHYNLFTEEYASLVDHFEDLRLPVDIHTVQTSIRTGIITSTDDIVHTDMASQVLREGFEKVIDVLHKKDEYAALSRTELSVKMHLAYFNLGSNFCTSRSCWTSENQCHVLEACKHDYDFSDKRYNIRPDVQKKL
ncbi:hypothetical protein HOD83_00745 [Candidatus Woesearchaeota archaeon]|jgi:hypothetical protein|nr:hypothetical protein [Candidatus Woesearchaeota archaeon]MBT4114042.1 hypothetical protein [Candidatus Woesearchaeota archaeon]MBT4248101.1 hypothetical protein [Candidatus Woesearchaeota archaeon]